MNPHAAQWFLVVAGICIAAPYTFRVPPRTRRQWLWVTLTLTFAAWVLLFMRPLRAQDAPPPVFRAGVDVVHVEVSVLDANRKPVRGLTAADFTVIEAGKPRPIVAFDAVELPSPARAGTEAAPVWAHTAPSDVGSNALPPEGRLVVLLIETPTPMGRSAGEALDRLPLLRRVAHTVIDGLAPGDLASIFFVGVPFNRRAVQDFTTDKARLTEAIDRPLALDFIPPDIRECPLWQKTAEVADAVAGIHGRRKSIIYIGIQDEPPKGCRRVAEMAANKLRLANVTMYEMNAAGLPAPPLGLESRGLGGMGPFESVVFKGFLAKATGGRTLIDNNPELVVPAIMEESSSYYVLAFPTLDDRKRPGEVHPIDVKVSRPGVTVFARSGYSASQTAKAITAEAKRKPLARAIDWTLPGTDVPMAISAVPFALPETGKAAVAISLRVAVPAPESTDAPLSPPRRTDSLSVQLAVLDPYLSSIEGTMTQKAEFPISAAADGPHTYELLSRLSIGPGRYLLRAAVETGTGARGGVDTPLEVPAFDDEELSVSGIAVNVEPEGRVEPKMALDGLVPFRPTPRRAFAQLDRVSVFFQVYRKRETSTAIPVTARVLDASGRVVFEQAREGAGDHRLELPVHELPPGRFLFEVNAVSGEHPVSRQMPFVVAQ
jgi:VWFA-related protein